MAYGIKMDRNLFEYGTTKEVYIIHKNGSPLAYSISIKAAEEVLKELGKPFEERSQYVKDMLPDIA
jgi:hypothetical protein